MNELMNYWKNKALRNISKIKYYGWELKVLKIHLLKNLWYFLKQKNQFWFSSLPSNFWINCVFSQDTSFMIVN